MMAADSVPQRGAAGTGSTLLVALLAAVLPLATAGQVYKWVDENGQVHYSEKKPATAKSTQLDTASTRAVADPQDSPAPTAPPSTDPSPCTTSLCRLVLTVEPSCNSSWCQLAERTADDCHTILCQKARSDVKRYVEDQHALARERARPAPKPVDAIAERKKQQQRAEAAYEGELVAKCQANHGIGCDNPEVIKALKKKDTPLTPHERQQALAERRRREQDERLRALR